MRLCGWFGAEFESTSATCLRARHPRQLPGDRSCRLWNRALAPPNQSRSILMRLSNRRRYGICRRPLLPTANSAGVCNLEPSGSPPPASRRVGCSRAPLGVSPRPVGIPLQWSLELIRGHQLVHGLGDCRVDDRGTITSQLSITCQSHWERPH